MRLSSREDSSKVLRLGATVGPVSVLVLAIDIKIANTAANFLAIWQDIY